MMQLKDMSKFKNKIQKYIYLLIIFFFIIILNQYILILIFNVHSVYDIKSKKVCHGT